MFGRDMKATPMMKETVRMLGAILLKRTPKIDPMNMMGVTTKAYW
jgi:hypothetical protein